MSPTISLLAIFAIVFFLGGAAFGALVLCVISIHRAGRAPLSDIQGQRGVISRKVLVTTRTDLRGSDE